MSKLDLLAPDSPEGALSRRNLVQAIGGTALAMTFLAGCGGSDNNNGSGSGSTSGAQLDIDILNFALNLEYLEAEFYAYTTAGRGIETFSIGVTGTGTAGNTTGGVATNFTSALGRQIANEIAADERAHVALLRTALGAGAIARPAINLNPFNLDLTSETVFLQYARAFEDVGVSAYRGAAPAISNKSTLGTAASILATEALHTGNVRLQAVMVGSSGSPNGQPLDSKDQLPNQSDTVTGQSVNFFSTDSNGLAFARTPREVLRIVLNQPTATTPTNAGGFFPGGVNGNLASLLALG